MDKNQRCILQGEVNSLCCFLKKQNDCGLDLFKVIIKNWAVTCDKYYKVDTFNENCIKINVPYLSRQSMLGQRCYR